MSVLPIEDRAPTSNGGRSQSRLRAVDPIADALALQAWGLKPLTSREWYAQILSASLASQSLARRMGQRSLTRIWHTYDLTTNTEVRRMREEMSAQVAALQARQDGGLATGPAVGSRRGKQHVHWHEGGDGPVILLINGWTASGIVWPAAWVRRLEETHRVVRIDNRGSGWSRTAPWPFTISDMADDAAAVLRAVGANTAIVFGISMGGMVAQELAIRHPARVERLVLCATRPPSPAQLLPDRRVLAPALRSPGGKPIRDYFRDLWGGFCAPGFAESHGDQIEELVDQVLSRPTPRMLMHLQIAAMLAWHGPRRLEAIQAPTTIIHGDTDPLMPVGNGMRLAQLIRASEYIELPGLGHMVPYERPDALHAILTATGST